MVSDLKEISETPWSTLMIFSTISRIRQKGFVRILQCLSSNNRVEARTPIAHWVTLLASWVSKYLGRRKIVTLNTFMSSVVWGMHGTKRAKHFLDLDCNPSIHASHHVGMTGTCRCALLFVS
jgi:hypothetical protein